MERFFRHLARLDRLSLDETTAERILDGSIASDDAPPCYRHVAKALAGLRATATDAELARESSAVAMIAACLAGEGSSRPTLRRTAVGSRRRFVQIAAASLVGSVSLFTGLAAANALPGAAQGVASDMLSHFGVNVHDPNGHAGPHPDTRGSSGDHAQPPTTSTPGSAPGPAVSNGQGSDISQLARTTTATGVEKGAAISTAASGGKSQAGQHGAPDTSAPAAGAPASTGGANTANTASGGQSAAGTANADTHSDGHSTAGSANSNAAGSHKP